MNRILLAGRLDETAERRLEAAAEVVRVPASDEQAICERIGDCDALVARTHTPVTARVIEAGRRLRVIGIAGVGLDRVDLEAAQKRSVRVIHVPDAASDAVAEFTVLLMLELLRPLRRLAGAYRQGRFAEARREPHGVELRGLCVGIVGMGRIGSRVGRICASGFGARVIYNDIVEVGPFDFLAEPTDKPALWRQADIVTLHVPLTDRTRRLIDREVLARMRRGAYLINTARGAVVDTDALVEALRSGHLAAAALDVTDPEPLPADHPLFAMENCIVTPHVAARTYAGLRRMYDVVDAVLAALAESRGGGPADAGA